MGTWNAFYIKSLSNDAIATVRDHFPSIEVESSPDFLGFRIPDEAFEVPEAKLADLSDRIATDVIWLSFQSTVDAFQFFHWSSGSLIRTLIYGCYEEERTWERVEGTPEPWEQNVFFDQRDLEFYLEFVDIDTEREELKQIWNDAEIIAGKTEPGLDSRDCAHKIALHYQFPHYGL